MADRAGRSSIVYASQRAHACVDRVRELNPLVDIDVHEGELPPAAESGFWSSFSVVCTAGLPRARNSELADACRRGGAAFFGGASHGLVSVFASDLGPAHRFKRSAAASQAGVGLAFKEDASAAVASVATPDYRNVVSAPPAARPASGDCAPTRASRLWT